MEGRAFLCKPVLGADEPRPPMSPCSPLKTATNPIPQCAVPWIYAGIRPAVRGCTEEETEELWLFNSVCSEQAELGGLLQLIQGHLCTLIPGGDWTPVDQGCCEWHKSHCHLSPAFPLQARAQSLCWDPQQSSDWHLQGSLGVLRCSWNFYLEALKRMGQPGLDWAQFVFCLTDWPGFGSATA